MKNENQLKLIHRTGTFEISSKLCCCCWIARLKSAFLFARSKDIQQLHHESVKRILLHDKALFRPCGAHQVQAKYELQYQYVKQHGTTVSKYNKVQN